MKILLQSEAKNISASKLAKNQQELINLFERLSRFFTSINLHMYFGTTNSGKPRKLLSK